MYVIVGLGNPGQRYANTRHNMGFITLDRFAERHNVTIEKVKFRSLVGELSLAGQKVLLVKPQTYMNLSGEAVRDVVNFYKIEPEHLLVIYDDIDIPTGSLRIRSAGSAGTHNGMRSVVTQLGTDRFPRIRVGIGSGQKEDLIGYVTGGFRPDEVPLLEEAVDRAAEAVECYLTQGIDMAMNRYNTGKKKKTEEDEQ